MEAEEKQDKAKPEQPEREAPRWRPTEIEELKQFFPSPEDREKLRQTARRVNAEAGIPEEPTMTLEEVHEALIARGVRPEDNLFSRELLRMRYGDDWDKE